jgi:hypothetical protein
MTTTNAQYWRDALQLESAELVKRLYKKIHGRELNTTRARQVVSAYLQGKEYYNAVQADISVQPLLLFYGVSSLSRALTLLLKQGGGEETLTQGHGLSCAGWSGVLTTDVGGSLKNLGALEVQSCSGMFTDLLNATENSSYLHVRSGKVDWSISYSIVLPINVVFSDLVQRIPDVRAEYTLWAEKPQLALFVNNITVLGDQFDIKTRKLENIGDVLQYARGRIAVVEDGDFLY